MGDDTQPTVSIGTLVIMLPFYFLLASLSFGIALPSGNFVPGIAIGAALGRLMGLVLEAHNLNAGWHPGAYALLGAAAVLSGMTRMTLTLAAILVEVADDIRMMPAIMLTLSVANVVAEKVAPGFDEAMMQLQGLPFLGEAPPPGLSMLTAQNAMASPVIVIPEVIKIDFLIGLLDNTAHNGFPVVRIEDKADEQQALLKGKAKFCGMILRRQLLVLLQERVWEFQRAEKDIPAKVMERFVGSFTSFADANLVEGEHAKVTSFCKLNSLDKTHLLDLRPFLDPSPLTVGKLMPLSRVYRLFNEIGVRHLPVIDPQHRICGIITRKDLHVESMEQVQAPPRSSPFAPHLLCLTFAGLILCAAQTIMRLADVTHANPMLQCRLSSAGLRNSAPAAPAPADVPARARGRAVGGRANMPGESLIVPHAKPRNRHGTLMAPAASLLGRGGRANRSESVESICSTLAETSEISELPGARNMPSSPAQKTSSFVRFGKHGATLETNGPSASQDRDELLSRASGFGDQSRMAGDDDDEDEDAPGRRRRNRRLQADGRLSEDLTGDGNEIHPTLLAVMSARNFSTESMPSAAGSSDEVPGRPVVRRRLSIEERLSIDAKAARDLSA